MFTFWGSCEIGVNDNILQKCQLQNVLCIDLSHQYSATVEDEDQLELTVMLMFNTSDLSPLEPKPAKATADPFDPAAFGGTVVDDDAPSAATTFPADTFDAMGDFGQAVIEPPTPPVTEGGDAAPGEERPASVEPPPALTAPVMDTPLLPSPARSPSPRRSPSPQPPATAAATDDKPERAPSPLDVLTVDAAAADTGRASPNLAGSVDELIPGIGTFGPSQNAAGIAIVLGRILVLSLYVSVDCQSW